MASPTKLTFIFLAVISITCFHLASGTWLLSGPTSLQQNCFGNLSTCSSYLRSINEHTRQTLTDFGRAHRQLHTLATSLWLGLVFPTAGSPASMGRGYALYNYNQNVSKTGSEIRQFADALYGMVDHWELLEARFNPEYKAPGVVDVASIINPRTAGEGPQVDVPVVAVPEMKVPEVIVPEIEVPEVTVPEIEVPNVIVPEIVVPQVTVPEIVVPEVAVPEIKVPDVAVPEIVVPEVTVPEIVVPKVAVPEIIVPEAILVPEPVLISTLAPAEATTSGSVIPEAVTTVVPEVQATQVSETAEQAITAAGSSVEEVPEIVTSSIQAEASTLQSLTDPVIQEVSTVLPEAQNATVAIPEARNAQLSTGPEEISTSATDAPVLEADLTTVASNLPNTEEASTLAPFAAPEEGGATEESQTDSEMTQLLPEVSTVIEGLEL